MKKPRALIFSGYGLNSEEETKVAFGLAGAQADIVHINDIIDGLYKLSKYQILAFPGGFSYGDDTGSGNAYAHKLKNHLWDDLVTFVMANKLVIGICNGFQIITNLGLVPALQFKYGKREAALMHNKTARYIDRWVDIKAVNDSPWLKGVDHLSLPISHGEGYFYASDSTMETLKKKNLIALQYFKGPICEWQGMEPNPNGALESIAGITDESGRVLGLMPHPERGLFFTNQPHWPYLKELYNREGKEIPSHTSNLKIFENAVKFFA